jgi:hypothetical protein
MAGQQAALYEAYRQDFAKKNADVIEPVLVDIKEVLPLRVQRDCYDVITRSCKYWGNSGDVVNLSDGRVAEFCDTRSIVPVQVAAVFPDIKAWTNYRKPLNFRGYFEHW